MAESEDLELERRRAQEAKSAVKRADKGARREIEEKRTTSSFSISSEFARTITRYTALQNVNFAAI
jgi:hypothetical protein